MRLLLHGAGIPRWSSQLAGRRGAGLRDFTAAETAEVDHGAVSEGCKSPNKTIYQKEPSPHYVRPAAGESASRRMEEGYRKMRLPCKSKVSRDIKQGECVQYAIFNLKILHLFQGSNVPTNCCWTVKVDTSSSTAANAFILKLKYGVT